MTSHHYTYILAAVLFTFTFGCISKDSIRYTTLPPKTVEQVALLPAPPDKPFKVIGHVFIDGSNKRGWQSIADAAREEAAEMGADAVVMGQIGQYQSGTVSASGPTSSTATTTTTGTANRPSFNTNSTTFAGPAVAKGVFRKQLSATAIVYENP